MWLHYFLTSIIFLIIIILNPVQPLCLHANLLMEEFMLTHYAGIYVSVHLLCTHTCKRENIKFRLNIFNFLFYASSVACTDNHFSLIFFLRRFGFFLREKKEKTFYLLCESPFTRQRHGRPSYIAYWEGKTYKTDHNIACGQQHHYHHQCCSYDDFPRGIFV